MVAEAEAPEAANDSPRLEQAYQGRAMFVKVSCKAGEAPVELSHHPELKFRFMPRREPLIVNGVRFEVRPIKATTRRNLARTKKETN